MISVSSDLTTLREKGLQKKRDGRRTFLSCPFPLFRIALPFGIIFSFPAIYLAVPLNKCYCKSAFVCSLKVWGHLDKPCVFFFFFNILLLVLGSALTAISFQSQASLVAYSRSTTGSPFRPAGIIDPRAFCCTRRTLWKTSCISMCVATLTYTTIFASRGVLCV